MEQLLVAGAKDEPNRSGDRAEDYAEMIAAPDENPESVVYSHKLSVGTWLAFSRSDTSCVGNTVPVVVSSAVDIQR